MPMMAPAQLMNFGHSNPSSNDSTVPETAPTAKSTAVPLAQRFASNISTSWPPRSQRHSERTINSGMPMPTTANTM
jgi:hypothetical protein